MSNIQSLDDSIFIKTREQLREEFKEKYGEYPKPLTEEEKRKYGIIDKDTCQVKLTEDVNKK